MRHLVRDSSASDIRIHHPSIKWLSGKLCQPVVVFAGVKWFRVVVSSLVSFELWLHKIGPFRDILCFSWNYLILLPLRFH